MATSISKADYLKRYMSESDNKEKVKKKKKKPKVAVKQTRSLIIDDDVDIKALLPANLENTLEEDVGDNDPTIAEFIDERPEYVKQMEQFQQSDKWKKIDVGSKTTEPVEEKRVTRHDSDSDQSPPRKRNVRHDSDSDQSPPRKRNVRHDSDSDQSPPRKRNVRHDSDSDQSPPRKRNVRHDSDSDQSPPRKRNIRHDSNSDEESDASKSYKSSHKSSRYSNKMTESSASHLSQNRKHGQRSDSDQSPPRRSGQKSDSDQSPQRKHVHRSDSDQSSSRIQKNASNQQNDSANKDLHGRPQKTLGGATAGLSTAKAMRAEAMRLRQNEDDLFRQIDDETLGRNAKTVIRESGRRKKKVEKEKTEEELAREKEMQEKYKMWGKGLKQVGMKEETLADHVHEMSKPLARYKDDGDLDAMLRDQDREGDPMLAFIKKKKSKTAEKETPKYKGPMPPPNRFGIMPGYRWDGVDRSNGFEKTLFSQKNDKKATAAMAYKWSTEDM